MTADQQQKVNADLSGHKQFLAEVFPAELREIARRRRNVFDDARKRFADSVEQAVNAEDELHEQEKHFEESRKGRRFGLRWFSKVSSDNIAELHRPFEIAKASQARETKLSTKLGLVGLAFSGGGIRSATFNLGVTQALAKHGILKHVDYLSTVSGGGYIGSCLSSVLNDTNVKHDANDFPFGPETGPKEPQSIRHLRNSGNYVAPGGLLDKLRIPALLLRGILINLLVIFPYIVLAIWVTDRVYGDELKMFVGSTGFPGKIRFPRECYVLTPWATMIALAWVGLFPFLRRYWQGKLSWRNLYEVTFASVLLALAVTVLLESLPTALFYYHGLLAGEWGPVSVDTLTWITAVGSVISFVTAGMAAGSASKWTGKLTLGILALFGPLIILLIYLKLGAWIILGSGAAHGWKLVGGVALVIYLYTRRYVDVNSISLHGFYRDRLSKAYLIWRDSKPNDPQKLSRLNGERTQAPYHLINAALNLQGNEDPNLRGRNADCFIFSKHYTGSSHTGFYPTRELEEKDPHLDLGTAMAISGAAAAPNMGTTTMKPLVFIMTLLNIRLGYWLPNPHRLLRKSWYTGPFWGVGPFYLLLELFGRLDEKSRYVNLSDGGHIENLGVYELLRRRCEVLIVGDGEADPTLTFGSLATVMRYAYIDMGIEIDIELDDIRKHSDGLSRKHCAVGKIRYPGGETGYLLYIKSSVTGEEVEYIREYLSQHPEFPHESTADQFFDEAQFEAYRALGFHVVDEVFQANGTEEKESSAKLDRLPAGIEFPESLKRKMSYDSDRSLLIFKGIMSKEAKTELAKLSIDESFKNAVDEIFGSSQEYLATIIENLEVSLRPRFQTDDEFVHLQQQLTAIEKKYFDPSISEYTFQVYPELHLDSQGHADPPKDKPDGERNVGENSRKIFHFCNLQMQLMENVFMALQLDKPENRNHYVNRGWINLFCRWAQAEYFRHAWAISIGTYSVGYQTFCEEALGLRSWVQWKLGEERELTHPERHYLAEEKKSHRFKAGDVTVAGRTVAESQLWIAQMAMKVTPGSEGFGPVDNRADGKVLAFPIGFATVQLSRSNSNQAGNGGFHAELTFYWIRDYYRNMRLLGPMMGALRKTLANEYPGLAKFSVDVERDAEILRRYGYFFERHGFFVGVAKKPDNPPPSS